MDSDILDMINRRIDDANANNSKRFDTIDSKLDTLLRFKWQVIGGSVASSAIITLVFQFISR